MATTSTTVLGFMDFLFASDLFDGEKFLVSDAKYAEDLHFQEDQLSFAISSQLIIDSIPELPETTNDEAGQSYSSQSFCEICLERKDKDQMFTIGSCFHSFCSDCISQHVITRVQQSTITCPGVNCKSVLELDALRPLLSKEVIIRWKDALCEEFIRPLPKFYCPFEHCSAMFVVDSEGEDIRQSECQFCHRMFCAKCGVPWHPGVRCEEFKELDERNRDDLMLRKLAKEKNWGRCPHCKVYVERTDGCPHMTCRCKFQFCYGCGEEWTKDHGGCERN
ncbi:hypothetical protein SLE2022_386200 [Rubroshorea leprosula]